MPAGSSGRRRRGAAAELNYWPAFVDALSTLLLAIVFLSRCSWSAQFFLSPRIVEPRHGAGPAEPPDLRTDRSSVPRTVEPAHARGKPQLAPDHPASDARPTGRACRTSSRAAAPPRPQADELNPALDDRTAGHAAAPEPDRDPEPADRRHAPPARGARGGPQRFENPATRTARPGSPISAPALMWRWPRGCRNWRAIRSDFFGRLRADPRQPAGCAHRRRPLRVPVGGAVSGRPGRCCRPEASGELDRIASALVELEKQIPPDIPWVIRVDGHTDARPDRDLAIPVELGPVGRPRHRRGAGISSPGASRRNICSPPASASSSLSTSARRRRPIRRNRRIELKLTER